MFVELLVVLEAVVELADLAVEEVALGGGVPVRRSAAPVSNERSSRTGSVCSNS
ncbi:hypothetical protein [Streptomyces sp. Amel2xC10]|uniref:hypothetical protein n=1 Tax=Streptomyces sp. Amel2xC10 TaxID=1305826 RepID=UPI0015C472EE